MKRRLVCGRLALLLALAGAACSRPPDDGWAVDVAAKHAAADRLLETGDTAGARVALLSLVGDRATGPLSEPRRLALQDAYFRLARLALAAHEPRRALADAEAGIALGEAPHLFVANLLVARGAAREALEDPRGAAADYHRALTMNEVLLTKALPPP